MMATLLAQKRMAASILKVGTTRVWMDVKSIDEISEAVTRDDVRRLIKRNVIQKRPEKGNSRGRIRAANLQRRKGRRKGQGSRKGTRNAREPRKRRWVKTIRGMRKVLRELRDSGKITKGNYRDYYKKIKGGTFRSKGDMLLHMKEAGILKGGST
ncbi:MAG: 50S ribosomal protein L19e [Thermoplasmatales archaeon]